MAKKKAVSTSHLDAMWRQAVLLVWTNQCGLCGHPFPDELECHHFIKRRKTFMRWDYRNGIPLCPGCHQFAHTKSGEAQVIIKLGNTYDALCEAEQVNYREWLSEHGYTDDDFRKMKLLELKEKIRDIKGELGNE